MIGIAKFGSVLAAGALALNGLPAGACSLYVIQKIEHKNLREECRRSIKDPAGFIAEFSSEIGRPVRPIAVANALIDGSAHCWKKPEVAFKLLDLSLGSPVTVGPRDDALSLFLRTAPDDLAPDRRAEVLIGAFLLNTSYVSQICALGFYDKRLPHGYSESEVLEWLLKPSYWNSAIANFGNNPTRDSMVLRQLIDPQSGRFDRALAGRLTPVYALHDRTSWRKPRPHNAPDPVDVEVAEALLDPTLGKPDFDAAANALRWYSPNLYAGLDPEIDMRSRTAWLRIATGWQASGDPERVSRAASILGTGDPLAGPSKPIEDVLPAGAEVVRLDEWTDQFGPFKFIDRSVQRIAERYPSRALREGKGGRVELGVIFDPEGAFHTYHVIRSAGETLDMASIKSLDRYLRPRIRTQRLTDYEGQYVYVPLPTIVYRHVVGPHEEFNQPGLPSGEITVTARMISR